MTSATTLPAGSSGSARSPSPGALRGFHTGAALLMLVLTIVGFHHFYLGGQAFPGRPLTEPIRGVLIAHGTAMGLWIVLFVTQTLLISAKKHKVHMKLGWVATALAAAILVLGWKTGVGAARVNPDHIPPSPQLTAREFLIVPIGSLALFAGFVTVGILRRKKPAVHRSMMVLGTLSAVGAAIARIPALNDLYAGTAWETHFGLFFMTVVIGLVLVVVRWAMTRTLDKWFTGGWVVLALVCWGIAHGATTGPWHAFSDWAVGG